MVSNLSALVAAADESTNDILSLFEVFKYFSKFKNINQQLAVVTSRLLTLVFSKSEKIENAVIKFFQSKFFDEKQKTKLLVHQFINHVQNASVSDLVSIEQIVSKIRKENNEFLFEFW